MLSAARGRDDLSTGMGPEMPLPPTLVEEVESLKLGLTEVVDVPGVMDMVVVERN